jgi:hypothetical protein
MTMDKSVILDTRGSGQEIKRPWDKSIDMKGNRQETKMARRKIIFNATRKSFTWQLTRS